MILKHFMENLGIFCHIYTKIQYCTTITYTKVRYVSETQHVDVICTLSFDRYVLAFGHEFANPTRR